MASQKRMARELAQCTATPPDGMTVALANDSDIHNWHITLDGPAGTAYAGGKFGIILRLPDDYPFKPPVVTFATRIYHPNVTNDNAGSICLGMLKPDAWKPATKLFAVLAAVRQLLEEPQPDDPLETRIADEYRQDRKEFEKNARAYVLRYAKGPVKFDAAPAAGAGGGKESSGASGGASGSS
ncbi:ubiquitin-conjugating enzyme/RWD-like protein [Podospora didyma]|uniref:E2 ubiquitin-conjugating enzyme n=1 Tax=Podospora didyma TaxID=330526 RepID=A0AAE0U374_9PEZI|nr:ubiquitin-conjugating enzyme/RWD-like protein [Podospora didyma]